MSDRSLTPPKAVATRERCASRWTKVRLRAPEHRRLWGSRIMAADVDTGDTREVTHLVLMGMDQRASDAIIRSLLRGDSDPAFSPDGHFIAFRRIVCARRKRVACRGDLDRRVSTGVILTRSPMSIGRSPRFRGLRAQRSRPTGRCWSSTGNAVSANPS